jgi:PAS domain S-box-containing protein
MVELHIKHTSFSSLALYIILAGWTGFAIYVALVFGSSEGQSFIDHFLSTEHHGIKFRALVFFLPFICTVIGFLVNEREKYLRKTALSEKKYRDLFENANDPIFIVDENLNYVDVNNKAVEVFGFSREEFLNLNVRDLIQDETLTNSAILAPGKPDHEGALGEKFVIKMLSKDGRILDIEISSSAIVKDNRIVGSREIVRDITELKQVHDELNEAYKELEGLVEEKTSKLMDTQKRLFIESNHRKKAEAALKNIFGQGEN